MPVTFVILYKSVTTTDGVVLLINLKFIIKKQIIYLRGKIIIFCKYFCFTLEQPLAFTLVTNVGVHDLTKCL